MRKAYKSILSLAVVLIAGLNFIVPAFAQDPFTAIAIGGVTGASGAGLFSSMASVSGVNIDFSNTDDIDAMWNVLNPNHVYFNGEKHEATGTGTDIYDYINVDISDWLDAQTYFISNFVSTYNVDDNDSGTITNNRVVDNIPVNVSFYQGYRSVYLDNHFVETNFVGSVIWQYGAFRYTLDCAVDHSFFIRAYYNNSQIGQFSGRSFDNGTYHMVLYYANNAYMLALIRNNVSYTSYQYPFYPSGSTTKSVDWTSDTVNTSIFDDWGSARVLIPKTISQLQTGWTVPDFMDELDRIWSGAGEDNILIQDGDEPPPVPPQPIPDTPLGNVPFDDWIDLWGQGIYQQLENQSDALDFIGSNGEDAVEELESIDSNLDDLNQTAESIDTNIGTGIGLLGGIKSGIETAVDFLEGIAEHLGELVEEIVEGTETLIAGILNQIPTVFGIIFGPIKQASSIWHYVVEWIQSIGAPFQFIWSMASGTSYYIILPVYASLAASVVLAFYKRFGK